MIQASELTASRRYENAVKATIVAVLFAAGCVSAPAAAQRTPAVRGADRSEMIVDPAALDAAVPAPASIIGHEIGDGAVRYEAMVRYLRALSEASPLVTLTSYAQSHEGRALHYLTITSEANHARLGQIMANNAKLADPRTLASPEEANRIIEGLPGIAWMAYCIHGDELSSTDAALLLAYQLAAGTDAATKRLRDGLVIHIDPLMNPDGRERYLGQLQPLRGKVPNSDYQAMQHGGLWSAGRGNHYLFDLNRDWLMQVHPETRGRAEAIRKWNPHLVVDSHEMGGMDTYLFDPPREPFNADLSEKNLEWRRRFSADQAKAFDRFGWSYYTKEWYEEWYPGYTNAWSSLLGAVGLLYEQAGVNAATVKRRTGEELTYREAVHHHFVSSLANLETLRANRREIARDYLEDRRWAVSAEGEVPQVFLLPPTTDRSKLDRFVDLLGRHGIESAVTAEPVEATNVIDVWRHKSDTKTFAQGTLVIRSTQPHRRLLRAVLDFDPHMTETFLNDERTELENRRGTKVYDVTAWNLSMAYGLEAYWADRVSAFSPGHTDARQEAFDGQRSGYGYLIDGTDSDIYRAIVRLLDCECRVRVAYKPFTIKGHDYAPGAVLLRNHENPEDLPARLTEGVTDLALTVLPVDTALSEKGPDLGGNRFRLLTQPRVAIASQWPVSTTSFGSVWHLLDVRTGLRSSPINTQSLGRIDLRKYNVLLLPHAWNTSGFGAVLNEPVRNKLKSWVKAGGTLIAMGHTTAFLADQKQGLSSTRRKRDVLDKLAAYEEDLKREDAARAVQVDLEEVWGTSVTTPGDDKATPTKPEGTAKPNGKKDIEALKRKDAWERVFRPTGAIAAARTNAEHWLCFGVGSRLPVLVFGGYAYMSKHPVATPVRLADEADLRLSGLLWPEARSRWAETAYATVERVGNGQVILFAFDPFFRGYFEGSGRLLLNAVILGPGLGTSQPAPW